MEAQGRKGICPRTHQLEENQDGVFASDIRSQGGSTGQFAPKGSAQPTAGKREVMTWWQGRSWENSMGGG